MKKHKRKNPKTSKDLVSLLNNRVSLTINKESVLSTFICEGVLKFNSKMKMYTINYDIPNHKYKFFTFFRLSEIDNVLGNNIEVKLTIKNKKEKLPLVKLSGKYVIFILFRIQRVNSF
jgi:hypothetical protein